MPKGQRVSGVEIPTSGIIPDRVRKRPPLSFGGMILFCDICYQLQKAQILHSAISHTSVPASV